MMELLLQSSTAKSSLLSIYVTLYNINSLFNRVMLQQLSHMHCSPIITVFYGWIFKIEKSLGGMFFSSKYNCANVYLKIWRKKFSNSEI